MIQHQAEHSDFIRAMSLQRGLSGRSCILNGNREPDGDRACISFAGTNHHKPVYSLQRHRDVWHKGTSGGMRLAVSLRESCRVCGFLFMLGYRGMTCGTTASALLNSLFTVQQIAATFRVNSGTLVTLPQS